MIHRRGVSISVDCSTDNETETDIPCPLLDTISKLLKRKKSWCLCSSATIDAWIANMAIPMGVNEALRALKINRRQFARTNLAINNEQPYRSQVIAVVIE